jgi:hypothetical protein
LTIYCFDCFYYFIYKSMFICAAPDAWRSSDESRAGMEARLGEVGSARVMCGGFWAQ